MATISRRSALKFGMNIGVALFAFAPAAKALATMPQSRPAGPGSGQLAQTQPPPGLAPPPTPPSTSQPLQPVANYRDGTVLSVSGDQVVLQTKSRGNVSLQLSSATRIWKGGWNSGLPINVGDHVDAWGTPNGTGLNVEKMWVNIVNLMGKITSLTSTSGSPQLNFADGRTGNQVVQINQNTIVDQGTKPETTYGSGTVSLQTGQLMQIIGLLLSDGTVQATRLIIG